LWECLLSEVKITSKYDAVARVKKKILC